MIVHSKLEICNQQDKIVRCYLTKRFTGATDMEVIEGFIFKKYKNSSPPFDIKIFDQHDGCGYVTLDEGYIKEYTPFHTKNIDATTVQSINSSETIVVLRVTLPDHVLYSTIDQQYMTKLEEVLERVPKQNEQIQLMDDAVSTLKLPKHPILLNKDPKMGFIDGQNVNYKQRDQYICDQVNVDTGETTGTLTMLQGEKNPTNKYNSVLPKFRIWHDGIKNRADHVWTLLVFIVLDVYQSGKRSLFYHPERTFVKNDDVIHPLNRVEIPITTDNWMTNTGVKLELTIVVIEGAKKHSSLPLDLICNLKDINASELFDSSCSYSKSCLALVLREDNEIQWETLVLSNEMVFKNKIATASITNILNAPANATSISSKRRRSNKRQTTSNQRSKRTKTQRVEDNSSTINLSTYNNDSSLLPNQILLRNYSNSPVVAFTSQAIPNIPIVDSEVVFDSTAIGNLLKDLAEIQNSYENSTEMGNSNGNSMTIMDNPFGSLVFPDFINTDNGDPLLYDPVFNTDLPNS